MSTAEHPECISIVIADEVYQDRETGKHIIAGVFRAIPAIRVPALHPHLAVFFTLTNARGTSDLSMSIEHEETALTLIEMAGPYNSSDPLHVMDVVVKLDGLVFPEFGKYWVQVKSGSRILQQRPLFLTRLETTHE